MEVINFNAKLIHPFNLLISAATQGGKTRWIERLLEKRMIFPWPEKILYIRAFESQTLRASAAFQSIEFMTNVPDDIADEAFLDKRIRSLIILDDQLTSINEDVLNLFIRGTHHLNRSCIMTVQNLFFQAPMMRTISLNSHYVVIMKQPRDMQQIEVLGRQMYPRNAQLFLDAYRVATNEAYGYLFLDFRSTTPETLRTRSLVLKETLDGWQRVFIISPHLKTMEQFVLIPISEVPGLQQACRESAACTGPLGEQPGPIAVRPPVTEGKARPKRCTTQNSKPKIPRKK